MIDIGGKQATPREAVVRGRLRMSEAAARALQAGTLPKGDALAAARTAGILAAKRTPELIPLCHPIPLSHIAVDFAVEVAEGVVEIEARARANAPTGVEMEAFTAAAIAAVTIYDMCKSLDPGAEIASIVLVRKSGGESGPWEREACPGRPPKGKLVAVCASARVGTRKRPLAAGVLRESFGLMGDAHAGSGRQVSLLAQESIDRFVASDAALQEKGVGPGDFAENLTTSGVVLHTLAVGTRIRVGRTALLEITQIGKTCHSDCEIKRLTGRCVMPTEGVFARVVTSGEVRPGDEMEVLGPCRAGVPLGEPSGQPTPAASP